MPAPRLEIFTDDAIALQNGSAAGHSPAQEEAKLAAYDSGYRAGWDDAVEAGAEDQKRIRADLAHGLQAMAFTYQEARMHVLAGLEPLLNAIADALLPEVARETLAPLVLDRIMPLAGEMADQPLHLVLNPASRSAVEELVTSATGLPLKITEEPSLAETQAYLRIGQVESKIDLTRVTQDIAAAVRAFYTLNPKADQDG